MTIKKITSGIMGNNYLTVLFIVMLSISVSPLSHAQETTGTQTTQTTEAISSKTNALADEEKVDPCAEENLKYDWGLSPCRQIQLENKISPVSTAPVKELNVNLPVKAGKQKR